MPHYGPWIQPADRTASLSRVVTHVGVQTQFAYGTTTLPPYPDATATLGSTGGAGAWDIHLQDLVPDINNTPETWTWTLQVNLVGVDLQYVIDHDDGTVFAPVTPSPADLAAIGAIGYELETPGGTPTGPFTAELAGASALSHHQFPDALTTAPGTDAIDLANVIGFRLPASWYTWDRTSFPVPALARWHPGPELAVIAHEFVLPASDGSGTQPDFSDVPPTFFWRGNPAAPQDLVWNLHLTDLDANGGFAIIAAVDLMVNEIPPPLPNAVNVSSQVAEVEEYVEAGLGPSMTVTVAYRPPRFRYLFPVLPRLRQYPRDDALGGSPRQGHVNEPKSMQSSARQGWANAYR